MCVFPGDLRDCLTCHVDGTQQVPENLPAGRLPTQTPNDWYTPQQPTAAACLGCHDSQSAAAHAFVNTAPFGESVRSCHGPERGVLGRQGSRAVAASGRAPSGALSEGEE